MSSQQAAEAGAVVVLDQVDPEGDASRMLKRTIEQVQAGDPSVVVYAEVMQGSAGLATVVTEGSLLRVDMPILERPEELPDTPIARGFRSIAKRVLPPG